jgi:hypothetical protein
MENVYLDLNLEFEHDHPDNRGWMNLFMHWAWAGIFQATWAISACTYGAKFQKFCAARLGLDIEENIELECIPSPDGNVPSDSDWLFDGVKGRLNPFEIKELAEHIATHGRIPDQCCAFMLSIKSPLTDDAKKAFCFGFALLVEKGERMEIDYFRIQDHLRRMGLGRRALETLVDHVLQQKSAFKDPLKRRAALESIEAAAWIEDHEDATVSRQFNAMLTSVLTAVGTYG